MDTSSEFAICRLFEEGDGDDLRRLTADQPEGRLAECLERYGGRRLSERSRAFWERVLDRQAPAPTLRSEVWPL